MKVLFDQGTPAPLRSGLLGHAVQTAYECGWQALSNGDLLSAAEADGYEVLITTDQNLRCQQDLTQRRLAVVVLSTTDWRRIQKHVQLVTDALDGAKPGAFVEVSIP